MAWVYFFSITLLVGAEVVAIPALGEGNRAGASIGPAPDGSAPQHVVLRQDETLQDQDDKVRHIHQ